MKKTREDAKKPNEYSIRIDDSAFKIVLDKGTFDMKMDSTNNHVLLYSSDERILFFSGLFIDLLDEYDSNNINIEDFTCTVTESKEGQLKLLEFLREYKSQNCNSFVIKGVDKKNDTMLFNSYIVGETNGKTVVLVVASKKEVVKIESLDSVEENKILKAALNELDTIVILDNDFKYLYYNENHKKTMMDIYGVDTSSCNCVLENITVEKDRHKEKERYIRALNGETFTIIDNYGVNKDKFYETKYTPIFDGKNIKGISVFTFDVSKQIVELKEVQESEKKFRRIYSTMSQGLAIHEIVLDDSNRPVDYKCLEVNESYMKLFGYRRDEIVGKRIKEVAPGIEDYWIEAFGEVALTGEPKYYENFSKEANKYLSTYAYSPKYGQFAVLISDISERISREKEIDYLSYNDQLTGLYNRRFYERKLREFDNVLHYPFSIILADVNGLKLVNDSFGHQKGDELLIKVSDSLRESCRTTDVITRIGGDEFVVLLPSTNESETRNVLARIRENLDNQYIESIKISVSFGSQTKENSSKPIEQVFKEAEDQMYRNKSTVSKSMRSKTIDMIITTLYEKNEREMFHSKRVSGYCEALSKALGLSQETVTEIRSAGLMHDIGKIGVDEQILNSSKKLTEKELKEVKKHSEIGYRILNSVPEFSKIAEFVLEHHERIDGKGYPRGLKGDEISLQSRIISIVDAYDAMTGLRPYKDPLSKQQAIDELIECKGKQFDANLVDVFIKKVLME